MVDLQGARAVVILTRAPSAGGKSRLFRELGIDPDPALLEALLLDTLDGATLPGVARVMAVTPPAAITELAARLPDDVVIIPQVDGDLGYRMRAAMANTLARGAAAVALIGSDLPHITRWHVEGAFAALDADPASVAIGPAEDGGYYLIASRTVPPLFDGVEWGSDHVLRDTRRLADARSVGVHLMDPLADVDSMRTLRAAAVSGAWRCARWLDTAELK
jgi:rSAM/selenodomain-associated transferase 1